jgi:hypothetical protein
VISSSGGGRSGQKAEFLATVARGYSFFVVQLEVQFGGPTVLPTKPHFRSCSELEGRLFSLPTGRTDTALHNFFNSVSRGSQHLLSCCSQISIHAMRLRCRPSRSLSCPPVRTRADAARRTCLQLSGSQLRGAGRARNPAAPATGLEASKQARQRFVFRPQSKRQHLVEN